MPSCAHHRQTNDVRLLTTSVVRCACAYSCVKCTCDVPAFVRACVCVALRVLTCCVRLRCSCVMRSHVALRCLRAVGVSHRVAFAHACAHPSPSPRCTHLLSPCVMPTYLLLPHSLASPAEACAHHCVARSDEGAHDVAERGWSGAPRALTACPHSRGEPNLKFLSSTFFI